MKFPSVAWLAGVVVVVIGVWCWRANIPAPQPKIPPTSNAQPALVPPAAGATNLVSGTPAAPATAGVQLRPLAVGKQSSHHEWTVEDGRDPNVIRQLAHNELEAQRMIEENARIKRRQLVYRKDTAAAVLQRARSSGEPVTQLALPGLDGEELQFTIDRSDLEPSQQAGSFSGHLAGRTNSLVTLAFQFGREAFTVMSPDDGLYLQGHPREPGEIIVTSFDPETYLTVPGGEPIRTTNTFSIAQ